MMIRLGSEILLSLVEESEGWDLRSSETRVKASRTHGRDLDLVSGDRRCVETSYNVFRWSTFIKQGGWSASSFSSHLT